MVRLFLVLAFAMSVASQPLENIGGATLSTHFFNWAQVGFEAFLEWAKRGFRLNTDEENTTTTTNEPSEYIFSFYNQKNIRLNFCLEKVKIDFFFFNIFYNLILYRMIF